MTFTIVSVLSPKIYAFCIDKITKAQKMSVNNIPLSCNILIKTGLTENIG